jgi:hypothetical protein
MMSGRHHGCCSGRGRHTSGHHSARPSTRHGHQQAYTHTPALLRCTFRDHCSFRGQGTYAQSSRPMSRHRHTHTWASHRQPDSSRGRNSRSDRLAPHTVLRPSLMCSYIQAGRGRCRYTHRDQGSLECQGSPASSSPRIPSLCCTDNEVRRPPPHTAHDRNSHSGSSAADTGPRSTNCYMRSSCAMGNENCTKRLWQSIW